MPRAIVDAPKPPERRTGAPTGGAASPLGRERRCSPISARRHRVLNVETLDEIFDFDEIRATSKRPESREAFGRGCEGSLGKTVRVVDTIEEAVVGADIVVEATRLTEPEPILRTAWLEQCTLLVPYGTNSVLELDVLDGMDKVVVDDWARAHVTTRSELCDPRPSRLLSEASLYAELGEIVAGAKPGREHDDERILFWHRGWRRPTSRSPT